MFNNLAYFAAVICEVDKEYIISNGIKKPVIKAYCYNSSKEFSKISVVFSGLYQIKKLSSFAVGDVILFSANIAENPKDNYVFYPEDIYVTKKIVSNFEEELSESFVKSRLLSYKNEGNFVSFEGICKETAGDMVCIAIKNDLFVRGDIEDNYHIWVKPENVPGDLQDKKCFFVGEVKNDRLEGYVFPLNQRYGG